MLPCQNVDVSINVTTSARHVHVLDLRKNSDKKSTGEKILGHGEFLDFLADFIIYQETVARS